MAKGRLLLVLTVLAAFVCGTVGSVSASVVAPVKGPRAIFIIKKHKKIHKRRKHHHRHHKKTAGTFKPVTTGIKPVKG
jgi:hypothetical protein